MSGFIFCCQDNRRGNRWPWEQDDVTVHHGVIAGVSFLNFAFRPTNVLHVQTCVNVVPYCRVYKVRIFYSVQIPINLCHATVF